MSPLVRIDNFEQFAAINLTSDPGYDPSDRTIPNCIEVRLNWALPDGKSAHNVLHGSRQDGLAATVAQAQSIYAALSSGGLWTALAIHLYTGVGFTGVSLRDLRSKDMPYVQSTGATVVGSAAGPEMPMEVAACLTLITDFTGPANRGRAYIPGWVAASMAATGNTMAAAVVTDLGAWGANWINVLNAQGLTLCIGQHKRQAYTGATGKPHPARAATTVPVRQVIVKDNHWDTQRRRGLK